MGIYIFNWPVLKVFLEMDDKNPESTNDFGKDIIPLLLEEKKKVVAYPFKGYWKDVGTVGSLWEANMDLLKEDTELDLFDRNWRIYSANPNRPPQYIAPSAQIKESLINEGCMVEGIIHHSVLFQGVTVEEGSQISDSVIMPDARVGKNAVIERAIIAPGIVVEDYAVIRPSKQDAVILYAGEE
jgi:glucose-1-phosphate adenylyltransferase